MRLHAGSEDAAAPGAGPIAGSDFYTAEEMAAMLKPKKKKLVRLRTPPVLVTLYCSVLGF